MKCNFLGWTALKKQLSVSMKEIAKQFVLILCVINFLKLATFTVCLQYLKEPPLQDESGLTFINTVNCSVHIQSSFYNSSLPAFQVI